MEEVFDGIVEDFGIDPVAFCSLPAKTAEGFAGKVGNGETRNGYSVPAFAGALDDEFVKGLSFEFLFGATGAVIVLATVVYGIGIRFYDDFDVFVLGRGISQEVYVGNDSEGVLYFVWDVLGKFFGFVYSYDVSAVVDTDVELATVGIGKAAYPFEVFVTPCFFVFEVLVFGHGIRISW